MSAKSVTSSASAGSRAGTRYGISDRVRSEWTKLRTVRSTMWALGAKVLIGIGISALATAEVRAHLATAGPYDPTRLSLTGTFFCQLVIGVLGVLVVSAEYGTGTIRATFAAAPRRPLVLLAKVLVFGIVVLVISELVSFASFVIGQTLLTSPAPHASFSTPGAVTAIVWERVSTSASLRHRAFGNGARHFDPPYRRRHQYLCLLASRSAAHHRSVVGSRFVSSSR